VPKVILSPRVSRSVQLGLFSDARWARITAHIPEPLATEVDARLRSGVTECCSWFLSQKARLDEGQATAAAMRRRGKGQLAPLERLAKGLRLAADAWAKIGQFYDDRLGDIDIYENLGPMARDAERRLARIRQFGKPITVSNPWPEFVRKVARCLREAGLNPQVTGRVYEHGGRPAWFQAFMAELNENLLGMKGRGEQLDYSRSAFYAEIAKALRGDRKRDKALK